MAIRVVIADDHSLVRQGLRRYLEMAGDIQVVGEASNGKEVLGMMENGAGEPDIVLLDIRMPEMDGLETARKIKQRHPQIGVIMLTAYDDRQFVVEAVRAGARGYVLKARDAEHLIQTVRLVAAGNMVIDPQLVVALADELSQSRERDRKAETLTAHEQGHRRPAVHLTRHGQDASRAYLREAGRLRSDGRGRRRLAAASHRVGPSLSASRWAANWKPADRRYR